MTPDTNTSVDEIADGIYRISTPVPASVVPGGFTFNQYLIRDDEPLLFHTGPRMLFPAIREAIERIIPVTKLRHVALRERLRAPREILQERERLAGVAGHHCGMHPR